jgi:hypothetical protein
MTAISWSAPIGGEPGVSYIIQYHTGLPTNRAPKNRAPKKQGSQKTGLPTKRAPKKPVSFLIALCFFNPCCLKYKGEH